jgi:hypothetical protein
MALPPHLQRDLRHVLRNFRAANGITAVPGGTGKALEAWVLMKLAQAAQRLPSWHVTLRNGDGSPLARGSPFQFPAGQWGICPSNPAGPGFVLLEHLKDSDLRVELHGGLKWRGRSGATHECDVSAVPAAIAAILRSNGGGTPRGLPIAAFECKDKASKGTADEMRQTLARLFDLALVTQPQPGWSCRMWEARTNTRWGRRSSRYVSLFAMGSFGIIRVGAFHWGASQLGQHYSIRPFGGVYDRSNLTIGAVTNAFRTTLAALGTY